MERRTFLWGAAFASMFRARPGMGQTAKAGAPPGERRILAEPGPMLPPAPAVIVSMRGAPGDPDELSVLWSFVLNGKPAQVGVCAHEEHLARKLLKLHGQFVLNVPVADMVPGFDRLDMNSSKAGDKYALSGFTRGRAVKVDAPTVAESPIQLECRVFDSLELPPARTLFVAEVLATSVLPGVCDERGRLLVDRVPFFGMTAGSGEFYTMGKRVGHIGQTVNRDDIRY
ncbi:MAG TPA: flavin reductase [Candidatus Aminicenantes bacterium]|nr:flavin reductase [Candidatus Aminicenantes bacterium]